MYLKSRVFRKNEKGYANRWSRFNAKTNNRVKERDFKMLERVNHKPTHTKK